MPSQTTRVDEKGRVLIPSSFREALGIKGGEALVISLNLREGNILLYPAKEKKLVKLKIGLSDKPGSLARIANVLAENGVDIVASESKSIERSQRAVWLVECKIGATSLSELRKKIISAGATFFKSNLI